MRQDTLRHEHDEEAAQGSCEVEDGITRNNNMNIFTGRNAHELLPIILDSLFRNGVKRSSRNGDVLQLVGPTLIKYERSWERVVFWPERDANPFFHLAESLWMLAGRSDVAYVERFAKRMRTFSDDGKDLNGAYGYRWRRHFGYDQLDLIIAALKANKDDRRQVLAMWDGTGNEDYDQLADLQNQTSKDVPCNTHAYFSVSHDGFLDMTVCNRSNDLVWGCLGANAVHFSMLQEYVSTKVGRPMGSYYQFTNNLHGYLETIEPLKDLTRDQGGTSPYEIGQAKWHPIIGVRENSLRDFDCDLLWLNQDEGFKSEFFKGVYSPMVQAHNLHKAGDTAQAIAMCSSISAPDWQQATKEWLRRRLIKRRKAEDDGVEYKEAK